MQPPFYVQGMTTPPKYESPKAVLEAFANGRQLPWLPQEEEDIGCAREYGG